MGIPLNYSLRALWLRRVTTLGTGFGIALVVFVLGAAMMLADGLEKTLMSAGSSHKAILTADDAFDESTSRVRQDIAGLARGAAVVKRGLDGIPLVSAETVVHVYLGKEGQLASVQLRGVPANVFQVRPEAKIVEGRALVSGTAEAVVGRGLLGRYEGLRLGGKIQLQKGRSATIVGVLAAGESAYESEVWVDLDTLRTSFGSLGYYSSVTAVLEGTNALDKFSHELTSDPRRAIKVERESGYYQRISNRLGSVISGLGGLVGAIFAVSAMLGAMITMYGSVDQRRKEIGTLRAIGFTGRQVSIAFLLEAGALALCGGLVGTGLALSTTFLSLSTINYATGQEVSFRFLPSMSSLAGALTAGVTLGIIGGLLPALKAASGDPIEALRATL